MTRPKVNRSQRRLLTTGSRRRYNRQQAARRNLFPDPTNNGDVDDAVRPLLPNEPRPHSPDFDIDIEAVVNPHNPILLQQQPVVPAEQQADEWENPDYFRNCVNNIGGVGVRITYTITYATNNNLWPLINGNLINGKAMKTIA